MAMTVAERKDVSRKNRVENKIYEIRGQKVGVKEITINCLDHPEARKKVRDFSQKLIDQAR